MSDDTSKRLRHDLNLGSNVLPGVEAIGATYNPFSGYASADNIVTNIFDWKKDDQDTFTDHGHEYDKPATIYALPQQTSDSTEVFGETIESYQEDLAAQVNTIATWSLQITVDQSLRKPLKDSSRDALDSVNFKDPSACEDFFNKHGSHIVSGIVVGGAATRSAATNKTQVDHTFDLKVVAKESFGFASGQFSSEQDVAYKTAVSSFESNSSTRTHIQGGDPSLGDQVFAGQPESAKWHDWTESVREAPVFVDFTGQHPLSPIWALCDDSPAGKLVSQGLREYYEGIWATNWSDRLLVRPDYIDSITVITGSVHVAPTQGYTKLDVDLNKGAEGDYVYFCYHKTAYGSSKQNPPAITDIKVLFGHGPPPAGYEKINQDLNKGAGGDYIYLSYKKDSYNPKTAILDITAFYGTNWNVATPYGYTRVEADLNHGAGGDYVFLAVAKQDS